MKSINPHNKKRTDLEKHALKQQAKSMHEAGISYTKMAEKLNVPEGTLHRWLNPKHSNYGMK